MGFSVFLVSYRGYGKSDGRFPTEAQVYSDAQAAWSYLVEQKNDEYLEAVQNFIDFARKAI